MPKDEKDFLQKLFSTFKVEAEEHFTALSSRLLELERTSDPEKQTEIIESAFREAHSLKGAARAVNRTDVEAISQSLESTFSALKRKEISPSLQLLDALHHTVGNLSAIVESFSSPKIPANRVHVSEVLKKLENASKSNVALQNAEAKQTTVEPSLDVPFRSEEKQKQSASETVRVSTGKLDALLLQAEEMIPLKLAFVDRISELETLRASLLLWKKQASRSDSRPASAGSPPHQSTTLLEANHLDREHFKEIELTLSKLSNSMRQDHYSFDRMTGDLLSDVKIALMLPFSSLLEIFPAFVRELARAQDKEVDLKIHGGEIEVDRRILEEMKDPLLHLVRNCIDHGIEKREQRQRAGKSARGKITIALSQNEQSKTQILISDDGSGIDTAKVRSAAKKLGIISDPEAGTMNDDDVLHLIFQSELTTSPLVTEISGRGLGLAIVREKVEKLNGTIAVETSPNAGTTFRMLIPATLATFRGILLRAGEQHFFVPTINVERVLRIDKAEVRTVENNQTISLNNRIIPLVKLADVLQIAKEDHPQPEKMQVIIIALAEKRIAFLIDEVLQEQEVLLKSLGKQLVRVRNIAGATILGTGRLAAILNVSDLLKSAMEFKGTAPIAEKKRAEQKKQSVLVVEDSITARMLLKNILESAGYNVKTAVDGIDGFTTLKEESFDLVVSDVDMPRMNGFNLTEKIRADKKLSELPVILVTALKTREDHERGIDVGANAYIVKSSFDQSNLLEVIRRLI